jgi:hypothetical protein
VVPLGIPITGGVRDLHPVRADDEDTRANDGDDFSAGAFYTVGDF